MFTMLTLPVLTDSQIECFKNDGFLVIHQAIPAVQMGEIQSWTDELVSMPEESGKHWVYHEKSLKEDDKDLICRIENITPFHDGFRTLAEAIKKPVGQLLGEDAVLFKEKINFKMPGGDGFKPHQDSQAGWEVYTDFFISVLLSIDEATAENGCLEICAGHHDKGLFHSWEPLSDADMEGMEFVKVPTKPGDLIFFDCFAPHQSQPNFSDSIRRIYYATYNRVSDGDHLKQYYDDKHKNYPPDIDRNPDKDYIFRV
jgi:hypothetical protein